MDRDTQIGGGARSFPQTRRSVLIAARSDDPGTRRCAFESLIAAYWKPAYKYIRIKWQASNEDAKDLTQEFFARAMEKGFFDRYEPSKSLFRTFLRTCLDGFVANQRKAAARLKRGGNLQRLSLDFDIAERELRKSQIPRAFDPEEYFRREWVRSVFGMAVDALRRQCAATNRNLHFALFERYDLEGLDSLNKPTYRQLADEFGLDSTAVTNYLAAMRRDFRKLVLETLRALSGSEQEFRAEAQQVLGVDPR